MQVTIYNLYKDITEQPHTLIAGATGSGKSVIENAVIYTLLAQSPLDVGLILLDPKKVELYKYKNVPHCDIYADEPQAMADALRGVVSFMERKYKQMQAQGISQSTGRHYYIIIDEMADLMTTQAKEITPLIQRIAQLGRASNIHLIICTQRPTADIIPRKITVNIDSRLALRVPTAQDSRNIIHQSGAELLPRYGKGYYLTPDTMRPVLYNLPMIPGEQIAELVQFWESNAHKYTKPNKPRRRLRDIFKRTS